MRLEDLKVGQELPALKSRVLGRLKGKEPGPTLLVVGGLHGNEPSGIHAVARVMSALHSPAPAICGEFIALAGNIHALERHQRFIDRDLNRQWTQARVAELEAGAPGSGWTSEDREEAELLREFKTILTEARGPVVLLDLHTTSADGVPFAVVGDGPESLDFARHFPVTLVLGLQARLDGVMAEYLGRKGCRTLVFEGGQHLRAESVERHVAVLWLALVAAGLMPEAEAPPLDPLRELLERARHEVPPVIEVTRRHAIRPEDEFKMEPGFSNVQAVRSGELLARDRRGEIHAGEDGVILMPLYQSLGDDGFFFCREVRLGASLRP